MDINALRRQGLTYAEIGRIVGRDWRTVKRYAEEGAKPEYRRKRAPSKLDDLKPVIDQWLAAHPAWTAKRIHQDLTRDYGFSGSYQTVRRYVERSRPRRRQEAQERFETAPGHQAQVDWSHEEPILGQDGVKTPLYCFHMVLGHSRDAFCSLTSSMDLVTFWACHRAAFDHFGGVPREILYDRTKTVVRSHVGREVSDERRIFHPEALASAHHYGFTLRLCRPRRPETKGKVESNVKYPRSRLFCGHDFKSVEEGNERWLIWNEDVARQRVHQTHGEIVAVRAERDRAALMPLPSTPYVVSFRESRKVARDGLVSFERHLYQLPGVPPGSDVEILVGADELIFCDVQSGARLAVHKRGAPKRILPDPAEPSAPLAAVMNAQPADVVHRRSLAAYEEATGWAN